MSFSASTCLTDLGTVALGGTFNIYSNVCAFGFFSNFTKYNGLIS